MKDSLRTLEPPDGRRLFGPARRLERWNHGAWIARDHTLRTLEILLDEAFRIPGTRIRFGLDGIIGLVPGVGDVIAGFAVGLMAVAFVRLLPPKFAKWSHLDTKNLIDRGW